MVTVATESRVKVKAHRCKNTWKELLLAVEYGVLPEKLFVFTMFVETGINGEGFRLVLTLPFTRMLSTFYAVWAVKIEIKC